MKLRFFIINKLNENPIGANTQLISIITKLQEHWNSWEEKVVNAQFLFCPLSNTSEAESHQVFTLLVGMCKWYVHPGSLPVRNQTIWIPTVDSRMEGEVTVHYLEFIPHWYKAVWAVGILYLWHWGTYFRGLCEWASWWWLMAAVWDSEMHAAPT